MDIDYQKQQDLIEQQQAQLDIERQRQELAMEAEAQHALVAEAAAYNEWAKAHPEEAFAAAQRMTEGVAEPPPEEEIPGGGPFVSSEPGSQEAPPMFEEGLQEDGSAPPNWPMDEDEV